MEAAQQLEAAGLTADALGDLLHEHGAKPHITGGKWLIEFTEVQLVAFLAEVVHKTRKAAAEDLWVKAKHLRGEPFRSGQVGIEYVNGMEDAAGLIDPED